MCIDDRVNVLPIWHFSEYHVLKYLKQRIAMSITLNVLYSSSGLLPIVSRIIIMSSST